MRAMWKLGVVLGAGAPLFMVATTALADDPAPPPPPPAPAAMPADVTAPPAAAPATAAASAGAPTAATSAPAVDAAGMVTIHIETKELVTLEHRTGPGAPWQHGCQTPCDAKLPGADEFRVVGEGLNESQPFSLTPPKGDTVKVHVAPGLKNKAKIGEYMTFTGAVLFVGAVVVGIGASDPGSVFQSNGTTNNYNWNVIAVGTAVGVAGLVTGIVGGAWWYDNSQTRVAGDIQGAQPARGGLAPRYQTGMRMTGPAAPVWGAPLFTTTF